MLGRMGWQWVLATTRGDERWRRGRKLLDRGLRPGAVAAHRPMLQTRAHVFLSRLLTSPHQWEAHTELQVDLPSASIALLTCSDTSHSFQGESILAMTYGYEAQENEDRLIDASKRMNKFGTEKVLPGALLVNYLPFRMSPHFHNNMLRLLRRALQCVTSPNGYRGLAISR